MSEIVDKLRGLLAAAGELSLDDRVEIFNEVSQTMKKFLGLPHPVTGVKLVRIDTVRGNDYNPNVVAPPEMRLLQHSIRKDGVTMPVVVARDPETGQNVVVDGFHRTTVIKTCPDVHESLGGYVPVVDLDKTLEDRMTSTVRHNLARGTHQVELSAKLVTALTKHHWSNERISEELGMDPDEVLRLKQITGLAEAFRDREFSKAWE
jgi:ParB-like chromosome segregation protein Spo0J